MFGGAHDTAGALIIVPLCVGGLIVAAYPIIKMIGWWADGGADPLLVLMGVILYVGLIGIAMGSPPAVAILVFVIIVASAIITPFYGQVSDQVQNKRIDDQQLERYASALEENPRNAAARIALAEMLHKRGELDRAIEHMSWTLEAFPSLAMRVRGPLQSWQRERERIGQAPLVFCHLCHAENAPGATCCYECGAEFGARAGVRQQVASQGGPRAVLRGWIVVASSFLVIAAFFMYAPAIVAGPVTLATCIVAAYLMLKWVGGDMGTIGD